MQETILITGGSGLVGSHLTQLLLAQGYKVRHFSRNEDKTASVPCYQWNLDNKYWDKEAIDGVDYIVNLAGAGVSDGRWTNKRKKQILESRVVGSQLVCKMVEASNGSIKGVYSSSAVGYYGVNTGSELVDEQHSHGDDFLSNVCVQWENSIMSCASKTTNVAILRTGIVLSKKGGALAKMLPPFNWGIGSAIGSGKQVMPWIHIEDLCQMYIYVIKYGMEGVYNAAAPEPVSNQMFTRQLAKAINRKIMLPNLPSFVLKLMFGEMAKIILTGVNTSVEKIEATGFKWKYRKLDKALEAIFCIE